MNPATLYGLTQQQRTRIVLTAFLAEDFLDQTIARQTAEVFGVPAWVVNLMEAADAYRRIEHRFDYQVITVLGYTLIHRNPTDGTEGPSIYWPSPTEPTAADLYTWALRRAATTKDHLDPGILKLARQLLCSEAGIASLDALHSEVRTHHLSTRELAHV